MRELFDAQLNLDDTPMTHGELAAAAKIADVLTYIRQDWGNKGGPVSAAQIAGLRKELASHPDSFVEADLKAVPPDAELPGGEPAGAKPAEAKNPAPPPATK